MTTLHDVPALFMSRTMSHYECNLPSSGEPPSFEYSVAALGLAIVPSWLISERHEEWTETTIDYRVSDNLVARGAIVRV